MPSLDEQPVQTLTFNENKLNSIDEDSVRALKEWMIVEAVSNIVIPEDANTSDPLSYFYQHEKISPTQLGDHPIEFGLTVNGIPVKIGNQMIHCMLGMYDNLHKKVQDSRRLEDNKEDTVCSILSSVELLCDMVESIQTMIKDDDSKKDHESRIQMNRERVDMLKNKWE